MNQPTKITDVLAGRILFRARPIGSSGASVNVYQDYDRRVANAARGLRDLQDIALLILRRLDIEAAERGEGSAFPCNALREELREALRGCDGHDARKIVGE